MHTHKATQSLDKHTDIDTDTDTDTDTHTHMHTHKATQSLDKHTDTDIDTDTDGHQAFMLYQPRGDKAAQPHGGHRRQARPGRVL